MKITPFPVDTDRRDTVQRVSVSRLLAHAKRYQIVDAEVAEGVCLIKSLELCQTAQDMGIPVQLVMWPIRNDAKFLDHWAVRVNQHQVIDLTYIQIDKRETDRIVFGLTDYPANFQAPRFYNPAPLLGHYRFAQATQQASNGAEFFIALRAEMLRQDLARARGVADAPQALVAVGTYIKFRLYFALARLQKRLHARHQKLTGEAEPHQDDPDRK